MDQARRRVGRETNEACLRFQWHEKEAVKKSYIQKQKRNVVDNIIPSSCAMPGIPSLRSPFRNRRFFSSNSRSDTASSTALPTLPPQAVEADQDVSESSVNAVDRVNVEQLRAALCAFLGIEEGRENAEFLNRYIQTFCAASAIMGDSNTLNNILGQSEDEFHNTLEICRLISEQFEIEISAQHQRQQLMESTTQSAETTETNLPPASERTIESLPFERILPADQANFQHDKTCCPICVEPLIDGLVLTRCEYVSCFISKS